MKKNPQQDIEHIRKIMEQSSRFISLSGLSGVFAGIFALIAALCAWLVFRNAGISYFSEKRIVYTQDIVYQLLGICIITLIAAIASGIFFTVRKSKKRNLKIWNSLTRRLLVSFTTPLITGGLFCIALFYNDQNQLIAPAMLIFYGLALINAGKYTYTDVNYLGFAQLALGLISMFFSGYGLIFWAFGFGVLHIIYGIVLHKKYH